jgi:uncharacterized protein YdeI (YjbR/CyaY-like superfamily)
MKMSRADIRPRFFATPADFREWLAEHHTDASELWVGFHKKATGKPSITWPESVDEALCVGWIDGVRKRLDDESYMIRFSPRRASSIWSAVNVKRIAELIRQGRVLPAGLKAFEQRSEKKTGLYSYEQRHQAKLDEALDQLFRANQAAWAFFEAQTPGYRKIMIFWVVSAKKEETRRKRLARLIDACARGEQIAVMKQPEKGK